MKKHIKLVILISMMFVILTGCSKSVSYSFSVETGDTIKVTLDATSGYSLSQSDGMFSVSADDEVVSQGMFITEDGYNYYYDIITSSGGVSNIETTKLADMTYTYYETESQAGGIEHNFLIWLNNSKTGIVLGSLSDSEKAKDVFNCLTFAID